MRVTFPAGDRGVIGVSNTDQSDALNGSSNYGQAVFLGAPGTAIATTSAGGGDDDDQRARRPSAADVAGAAALLKAASGASNGVIVSRLAQNAEAVRNAGADRQRAAEPRPRDRGHLDRLGSARWSAPIGGGGPFVGPYTAALTRNMALTFAGARRVDR